jgi:endonuclease/exonuclease/phosphatase family metal-dependent hydrolase
MLKPGKTEPSPSALSIAAGFVLIGGLHATVGDTTWWGECVTVWPTLGWLVLVTPRLALWAHRRQWRNVVIVASLAITLILSTTEWLSVFRRSGPSAPSGRVSGFRVVTWNVAGGMPLDELDDDAPDVALLQEIGSMPASSKRPPRFAAFEWLADFDPGTLSRTSMARLPTRRIGPWQEPQVLRTSIAGRRVILVNVRLTLPAFVVAVATLEPPSRLVQMHAERLGQFVLLRNLIAQTLKDEHTSSAVLCGDFNSPGGIQSTEPLRSIVRDVWPEGGRGWGATMPAWLPMSRIDQCWVTPDIEVISAVVRRGGSDHRRLVVDLAFR